MVCDGILLLEKVFSFRCFCVIFDKIMEKSDPPKPIQTNWLLDGDGEVLSFDVEKPFNVRNYGCVGVVYFFGFKSFTKS